MSIETYTIILDIQTQVLFFLWETNTNRTGGGILDGIVQRFFENQIEEKNLDGTLGNFDGKGFELLRVQPNTTIPYKSSPI